MKISRFLRITATGSELTDHRWDVSRWHDNMGMGIDKFHTYKEALAFARALQLAYRNVGREYIVRREAI